jgi:hypothetical protein
MVKYVDSKCKPSYLADPILEISLELHDMAGGVEFGVRLEAVNHCV